MKNLRAAQLPDWALWIIGVVTILSAAILILAVVLGVRAGQQQIEIQARQKVGIHLQRAIDLRAEGDLDAALVEYQQIMLLDPGNATALEGIERLLQLARAGDPQQLSGAPVAAADGAADGSAAGAVVGTEAEAGSAPPGGAASTEIGATSPLPTPVATLTALEQQWAEAEAAYTTGRWAEVVPLLERISAADPAFEAADVKNMLFDSYVNLGAEKDQAGNLEEALEWVDEALKLRPNERELRTARSMAANYLDVLTYFGADWEKSVALLSELYLLNPAYRDVEERLQEALVALGDNLVGEGDWCAAADEYISAIEIDVTPGLLDKRDQARDRCREQGGAAQAASTRSLATRTSTPTRRPPATSTPRPGATATTRAAAAATTVPTLAPTATATGVGAEAITEVTPDATTEPTVAAQADAPTRGRLLFAAISPDDNRSRIYSVDVGGSGRAQVVLEDGSQPSLRSDGVRLAYYNTREDMAGISSFDPATGLELRFTRFAEDRRPSWSPDGNRIVFASNREGDRRWRIYVTWAETDGAAASFGFGESPAWHPSADRIVFRGCDETGNRCGLWTMTSAGAGSAPLTSVPTDTLPAWSPDGRYVVFTSNGRHSNFDIYRVDTESGDVLRLTDHPANDGVAAVSPDGSWVAFLSDRSGVWQIWAIPLAGGDAIKLADLPGGVGNWLDQNIQWMD